MSKCSKCGADNDAEAKFCMNCGAKFEPRPDPVPVPGEDGAFYCYKHKKEITRVTCGRCEKPICHLCTIVGPAGVRCPECARQNIPVSGRAIWFEFTQSFKRLFRGGPMSIYFTLIVASLVFSMIRGCMAMLGSRRHPEPPPVSGASDSELPDDTVKRPQ